MSRQDGDSNHGKYRGGYKNHNHSESSFDSSESGDRFEEVDEEEAYRDKVPITSQMDNQRLTNFRGGAPNVLPPKKDVSPMRSEKMSEFNSNVKSEFHTNIKSEFRSNDNPGQKDLMQEFEQKRKMPQAPAQTFLKLNKQPDNAQIAQQRSEILSQLGFNGYMNIIQKNGKINTFEVSDEYSSALNQLEQIELYGREYMIVSIIYLVQPPNKQILSEEIGDSKLSQDKSMTQRKKFFEWSESIAQAKIFPNESRDSDILIIEFLTSKVSQSQAKHITSLLSSLSSKVVIYSGDEDLVSTLNTIVLLTCSIKEIFDFAQMKTYKEEDLNDIVSDIAPKLTIFSTNQKLVKLAQDKKAPQDLLDHALDKINDQELKSQFLVMYKSRDLHIQGSPDAYSLKQKILFETMPKEFMGRKVKTTPAIALNFLSKVISQKNKIKFQVEQATFDHSYLYQRLTESFQQKIDQIFNQTLKQFKDQIQGIKGFPKDSEELTLYLLDLKNEAIQKINTCKYFALTQEQMKKIEEKRKSFENSTFQSGLRQCLSHNENQSTKKCTVLLTKLFEGIQQTISDQGEGYSLKNLATMEHDIQEFLVKYCDSTGLGPSQTAALLDFLDQNLISIYKNLIQSEVDGQMKKLQNEEQEINELHDEVQKLEKQYEDKKRKIQSNRDKIDELQGKLQSQKREVDNMDQKFQNYDQDLRQKKDEILELEEKHKELKKQGKQMEEEAKKQKEERIKKLKEEQAAKNKKKNVDNTEKCKCNIY